MPLRRRLLAGVAILAAAMSSVPLTAAASPVPATATVTGTVSFPEGETWDLPTKVQVAQNGTLFWNGKYAEVWVTAENPTYSITLPAGEYSGLYFNRPEHTTSNVVSGWWGYPDEVAGFSLADGQILVRDYELPRGASISGRIATADGQPLVNARADVCGSLGCYVTSAWTDADGHYSAVGLQPGDYTVKFTGQRPRHYHEAWAPGSSDYAARETYSVGRGEQVTGVDGVLIPYGAISGTFTKPAAMGGINVLAFDATTGERAGSDHGWLNPSSDTSGHFTIEGLAAGTYRVAFVEDDLTPISWWPNAPDEASARIVSVAEGQDVTGLHTDIQGIQLTINAEATRYVGHDFQVLFHRFTTTTGSYQVYASMPVSMWGASKWLAPGRYRVQVIDPEGQFGTQYWPGTPRWSESVDVTTTADLDFLLEEQYVYTSRLGGADRFEVSARIGSVFDSGVPVAYVTNGLNFPDALSAAPAAIVQGGPLLLVTPTSIPAPVAARLEALDPEQIVIVGGPVSVSDAVAAQLATFVSADSTAATPVVRVWGADRYASSRSLARFAFGGSGADTAYLATGNNFPDALSAAAIAGHRGAPVILVDGVQPTLDGATVGLLDELGVEEVVIAGGPLSVSLGIQARLEALGFDVVRRAGADRYETSWSVNADFPAPAEDAFLAVGTTYPDALSGAAWAGYWNAPLYVVPPNCVPATVIGDIFALDVVDVHLLGGTAALSDDVLRLTPCEYD